MSLINDCLIDLVKVTTLADVENQTRVSRRNLTKYIKNKNIKPLQKNSKPIFDMWIKEVICHG
jgi:RecA/RadA recombinase